MKNHFIDDDLEIVGIINPKLLVQNGQATQIHLKGFTAVELAKLIETITEHGGTTVDNSKNAIVLSSAEWHSKTKTTIFHVDWLYDSIKRNKVLDLQKYQLRHIVAKTEIKEENVTVKEQNIKSEINTDPLATDLEKTNVDKVKSENPIIILSSSDEEEEEEVKSEKFRPDLKFGPNNNSDRVVIDSSQSDKESVLLVMNDKENTKKLNFSIVRETRLFSNPTVGDIDSLKLSIFSPDNVTTSELSGNDITREIAGNSVVIDFETSQSDEGSIKPTISDGKRMTNSVNSAANDVEKSNVDKVEYEDPITILSTSDEEDQDFQSRKFRPILKFGSSNNSLLPHGESVKPGISSNRSTKELSASFIRESQPSFNSTVDGIDSLKLTIVSSTNATTASGLNENDVTVKIAGDSVIIDSDTPHYHEENIETCTNESETMTKIDDSINSERPHFSERTDESIQSSPLSKFSSSSTASQGLNRDDSIVIVTSDLGITLPDTSEHDEAPAEPNIDDENAVGKCENFTDSKISHSSGPANDDISSSSSFTTVTKIYRRKSRKLSDYVTSSISSETSFEDENVDELKEKNVKYETSKASRTLRKYNSFTTEEENSMIQYLIDQKAFFKAGGEVIWQFMIDDGLMKSHKPGAMKNHFENHLKYRIEDYTNDPEILKKFQLREEALETNRRLRKKRKIYMELEFDE